MMRGWILDLPAEEIERRYRIALEDIRRGGTGDCARPAHDDEPEPQLRTRDVLAAIAEGETTVTRLAERLGRVRYQVWGHVCFLRKMRKVEVRRYETNAQKRRIAVYGVVRD